MYLPNNLVEMFHNTVNRGADDIALMWKENGSYTSATFGQVWQDIKNFALGLKKLGVTANSKVAIWSENNPRWLISDFAILSLGAVSVPIYPTLSVAQAASILEDASVSALIVGETKYLDDLLGKPSVLDHVIVMKGDTLYHNAVRFSEVLSMGKQEPDTLDFTAIARDDLASLIYTSGTTGKPKGVMLSHGNILSNIESISHYITVSPEDRILSMLPLSHVLERTVVQFLPVYSGATIAYAESIYTVIENMKEVQPTIIMSVPRLYEKIYVKITETFHNAKGLKKRIIRWALDVLNESYFYKQKGFNWAIPKKLRLKSELAHFLLLSRIHEEFGGRLRFMGSGGASLDPGISHFFNMIGLPVVEAYGMTECSPGISANNLSTVRPGTVGRALPGAQLRLADDNELLVKSPSIMLGYYNKPDETDKVLVDGWLHTGDVANIDDYGYVKIVDRKKSILVLSNGKNVIPQPIEIALSLSRFIHQSAIIGHGRNYVTALIVPDFEVLATYASNLGLSYDSRSDYINSPQIHELIEKEIEDKLKDFSRFEKPKKFKLLAKEFSMEENELTPTLKLKMSVIEKNYSILIESMYEGTPEDKVAASST